MIFLLPRDTFKRLPAMNLNTIRHDWITQKEESSYSVIPDEYCVLGIQVQGRIHLEKENSFQKLNVSGITGMMTGSKTFKATKNTVSFLIRIPPWILAKQVDIPLNEIVNESLSLDSIFPENAVRRLQEDCIREHEEDLESGSAWKKFQSEWKSKKSEPKYIAESIERIRLQSGETSISSLAASLGISQSKLEKDYKEFLGLSPKDYACLIRFRNALLLKNESSNLTDLAYRSGCYDQAHFIREFKKRTGQSPKRWFQAKDRSDQFWNQIHF
ncbi:AraC family transcriptional regulator [Leptospira kmetyi]|uniref:AraC family transcriptional regulator n=1 Tax=Leptospira kmetyi TaxID=408139 RepID=A0AAD0XQQ9_9LEPT|nr:helix-turn-helix domain-containing protein [Leptospira kmetyi]AYV56036.1 AraC family transcriptional regulator [Leptospira kmetyi]